jgi:ketosteroid isomerase-like protein
MSDENVALVRRTYEVINAIGRTSEAFVDPEEVDSDLWEQLDPAFELHERPDLPDRKVYCGREESKEFWRKTQELFSELRWEPRDFADLGHAVVVDTRLSVLGRGSELPIEVDETDVFWFREGRIVRLQGFPSHEEAVAAARSVSIP